MSKQLDPQRNLSMAEMAEVSNDEYAEYLRDRIAIGLETEEALKLYHVVMQKRFTDEYGVNKNPITLQTFTKEEMSVSLTNMKRVLENQGYVVKVVFDPNAKAAKKHSEPKEVIESTNDGNPVLEAEPKEESVELPSGENAKMGKGRGRGKSNN